MCLMVPPQTALHWAAKHGSADVVKLIAGTYQADVNARSVSVSYFTRESFRCLIILRDEPTAVLRLCSSVGRTRGASGYLVSHLQNVDRSVLPAISGGRGNKIFTA
jgi:ankyrin repeat protein